MDESTPHGESCPRCRALEARVAELERLARAADPSPPAPFRLTALRVAETGWGAGWELRPSPPRRPWMDAQTHAYQCLPMVVANQWGWHVTCPTDVVASWDGHPDRSHTTIEVDPAYAAVIKSQFGMGIVTFSPPWLFRTSPGWDLYAKGPSNRWKPNAHALEGVVETWWLNYTYTLNWKIVQPGSVGFRKGEVLGQLVPVPHATFQGSEAVEEPISAHPDVAGELARWQEAREKIAADPVATHRRYLKAEGIAEHLSKVPVPPVSSAERP